MSSAATAEASGGASPTGHDTVGHGTPSGWPVMLLALAHSTRPAFTFRPIGEALTAPRPRADLACPPWCRSACQLRLSPLRSTASRARCRCRPTLVVDPGEGPARGQVASVRRSSVDPFNRLRKPATRSSGVPRSQQRSWSRPGRQLASRQGQDPMKTATSPETMRRSPQVEARVRHDHARRTRPSPARSTRRHHPPPDPGDGHGGQARASGLEARRDGRQRRVALARGVGSPAPRLG